MMYRKSLSFQPSSRQPSPDTARLTGTRGAPARFGRLLGAVLAAAVILCTMGGCADGSLSAASGSNPAGGEGAQPAAAYEYEGVTYQISNEFTAVGSASFLDSARNTTYSLSVYHGADASQAVDVLMSLIVSARFDDAFEGFSFEQVEQPGDLAEFTSDSGAVYQYNIMTITNKDGSGSHTGVVLADNGTLVSILATYEQEAHADSALSSLRNILKSVAIDPDYPGADGSDLAEITTENYQSLFQLAQEYDYVGIAYYLAPYDLYGTETFVDAYIPYGAGLEHLDDGTAVQSQAHGLRVYVTMAHSAENARTVVDEAYQAMVEDGVDFYTESPSETYHDTTLDIAVRRVMYFEDNKTVARIAILYADVRQNGYYQFAQITYLPEQFDEEYPALLAELCDVFAMNLPEIPPMD